MPKKDTAKTLPYQNKETKHQASVTGTALVRAVRGPRKMRHRKLNQKRAQPGQKDKRRETNKGKVRYKRDQK